MELKYNKKVYGLLSKAVTSGSSHPSSGQRELHFVFFRTPHRFLESDERSGYVSGVNLEKTVLKGILPYTNVCHLKIVVHIHSNESLHNS